MKPVRPFLSLLEGLVMVAAVAGIGWAAWEGSPGGAASTGVLSGKITSVDARNSLLKVSTGLLKQTDFIVKESTKISDGSNVMTLQDLKPGDEVTVSYQDADGKHVAQSMIVSTPAEQSSRGQLPLQPSQPANAP